MQRKSLATLLTCAVLALGVLGLQAADVAGKWSWTMGRPGGGGGGGGGGAARKITATFKAEGAKLTGKIAFPGRQGAEPTEIEIKDGKVNGDNISFTTTMERGGNTMTSKYSGKVEGDTIKGKIEREGGNNPARDWEAKREK